MTNEVIDPAPTEWLAARIEEAVEPYREALLTLSFCPECDEEFPGPADHKPDCRVGLAEEARRGITRVSGRGETDGDEDFHDPETCSKCSPGGCPCGGVNDGEYGGHGHEFSDSCTCCRDMCGGTGVIGGKARAGADGGKDVK